MARAVEERSFQLYHRVVFRTVIRGHHVYKSIWTPCVGESLVAHRDDRSEALQYDKFAIGTYKKNEEGMEELVGHVPIELSSLLYHFLSEGPDNHLAIEVTGKRKREVGLVVPAKFTALTKDKRVAMVLDEEKEKMYINLV